MSDKKKESVVPAATTESAPGLLTQIIQEARWKDPATQERGRDLIKQFVAEVLDRSETVSRDAQAMINARIVEIDRLLSDQLNEVLHNEEFQQLESSWRGLKYLLNQRGPCLLQVQCSAGRRWVAGQRHTFEQRVDQCRSSENARIYNLS